MTTLREAAQQALVDMACMRDMVAHPDNLQFIDNAITALRTALAEPEQDDTALLRQALEALEGADEIDCDMRDAINALRERLYQNETAQA